MQGRSASPDPLPILLERKGLVQGRQQPRGLPVGHGQRRVQPRVPGATDAPVLRGLVQHGLGDPGRRQVCLFQWGPDWYVLLRSYLFLPSPLPPTPTLLTLPRLWLPRGLHERLGLRCAHCSYCPMRRQQRRPFGCNQVLPSPRRVRHRRLCPEVPRTACHRERSCDWDAPPAPRLCHGHAWPGRRHGSTNVLRRQRDCPVYQRFPGYQYGLSTSPVNATITNTSLAANGALNTNGTSSANAISSTKSTSAAPSTAPLPGPVNGTLTTGAAVLNSVGSFVIAGCYLEGTTGRALPNATITDKTGLTVESCVGFCQGKGLGVAGVEYGQE